MAFFLCSKFSRRTFQTSQFFIFIFKSITIIFNKLLNELQIQLKKIENSRIFVLFLLKFQTNEKPIFLFVFCYYTKDFFIWRLVWVCCKFGRRFSYLPLPAIFPIFFIKIEDIIYGKNQPSPASQSTLTKSVTVPFPI